MTSRYALILQSQAFNVIQNDQPSIKVPQRSTQKVSKGSPDENLASCSNLLGDCRTVFTACFVWRKQFRRELGQCRTSAQRITDSKSHASAFAYANTHRQRHSD
jgi:hypothetical protein